MLNKIFSFGGVIVFMFSTFVFAQNGQEQNAELQNAYMEYQQISQHLQSVQQQALSDSSIAKKSKEFGEKLDSEMIEHDPTVKEKLQKRDRIINNFEDAQKSGNQEKLMQLQQEYQLIAQDLQSHQQEALQDQQLLEEGRDLEDAVVKKMTEIDPEVPDLFARLEALGKKLEQFRNQQ